MARLISSSLLALFTIMMFIFFIIDLKKKRPPHKNPMISFIIPCYNDGHSIQKCIESIYTSYNQNYFELIIINDSSTDNSVEVITSLQSLYNFSFIDLPKNGGKSAALNHASRYAQHDIISFVDADTEINKKALNDVLDRFESSSQIGAISCPYTSSNKGSFRSTMQDIEYAMLRVIQWSYNIKSALAAWWGYLTVRKKAFQDVWWFALHAITEDMYLALEMNKKWRIVQQSPCTVQSEVPDNFRTRLKQKIRRCSGAIQAFLSHISVWIRNPMHVIYTTLIHIVTIVWSIMLITKLVIFWQLIDVLMTFVNLLTFQYGWNFFFAIYGNEVILNLVYTSIFTLFSLPYVLLTIRHKKEIRKILLLFPYAMVYMSIYSLVGLYSTGLGIYKFATLEKGKRSW